MVLKAFVSVCSTRVSLGSAVTAAAAVKKVLLTWVFWVVLSRVKYFQWASHIKRVHVLMESDENLMSCKLSVQLLCAGQTDLDRLVVGRFFHNCTHLAGIVWSEM